MALKVLRRPAAVAPVRGGRGREVLKRPAVAEVVFFSPVPLGRERLTPDRRCLCGTGPLGHSQ